MIYICLLKQLVLTRLSRLTLSVSPCFVMLVCATPRSCLQVIANVVEKLPPCEAVQLQRVSQ